MKSEIDTIRKKAMESEQGDIFPLVYKSLKEIGITSYSVDLESGKRVYTRDNEQFEDNLQNTQFTFGSFNKTKIAAIIQNKSQKSNSNFDEWLNEMNNVLTELSKAGVHRYIVTMTNDLAIYIDKHNTQAYVEFIPSIPDR